MTLLFIIGWPILEIWLASEVADRIGGVATALVLAVEFALGMAIAQSRAQAALIGANEAVARGRSLNKQNLYDFLGVAGGILIAVPGFASDLVGLAFLIPGARALSARALRRWIESQLSSGRLHVFANASNFRPRARRSTSGERDVSPKVIDVTPTSRESSPKNTDL